MQTLRTVLVRTSLVGLGFAWLVALRETAPTRTRGDPADSEFFFLSYGALPLFAFIGALLRIERSPVAWACMVLPALLFVVGNAVGVLQSFDDNAFWILGFVLFAVLGGLIAGAAAGGSAITDEIQRWSRERSERDRGPRAAERSRRVGR